MKTLIITKISRSIAYIVLFIGLLSVSNCSFSQSKKYTEKDMPSAVNTSFQNNFPGAIVRGYDKETEDGVTTYEVEATDGNIKKDIQFDIQGNIVEIEESMNSSDLPEKVVTSINSKYSNPSILKSEKVTKGTDILYEVQIKIKNKKSEIRIDKEGSIVEVE